MSETITEMILPGTYIDVRAEGLIGVGGISTGNLGVVGTASRGPVDEVVLLGSYDEAVQTFGAYDRWATTGAPLTLTRLCEQLFRGGASTVYAVRVANMPADTTMAKAAWMVRSSNADLFSLTASSAGTWANGATGIQVAVAREGSGPFVLEIKFGRQRERFTGNNAESLVNAVNATSGGSSLVTAALVGAAAGEPAVATVAQSTQGGPNGAPETTTELTAGLTLLARAPVNLLVVGLPARTAMAAVSSHLDATETDGSERIAVLGVNADGLTEVAQDRAAGGGPRVVLVAPGIVATDAARVGEADKRVQLPGPYAAALVAGRLATLAPHVSLTNKTVPVEGLTTEYTRAQQKQLLQQNVMVLHKDLGFRALRGITTDTAAFKQISVRRIVDYAKAGVRQGANPYIGRLNNSRVRAALKATLDGFLAQMVLDEMLIGYTLDVTATRAEEIAGIALVTMTLQPTFSIDFVKVIMNLE